MFSFEEFLKQIKIDSPLAIDFRKPNKREPIEVLEIQGLKIPLYGKLVIGESILLQAYQQDRIKKSTILEMDIERLAFNAKKTLKLESVKFAKELISSSGEDTDNEKIKDIKESDEYYEWLLNNTEALNNLLSESSLLANFMYSKVVYLTCFLYARLHGNWSLEDTLYKDEDEFMELYHIYEKEAGLLDETEEEPEEDEVPEDAPLGEDSEG